MKTSLIVLVCGVSTLLSWPAVGWTQASEEPSAMTKEEQQMEKQAGTSEGEQKIIQRFVEEFGVDEARVSTLRTERLGYGEIHHLLSLARQMPNGITDDNVNQILQMRQEQHMGWGNISKTLLNQKLGPAITNQPTATTPTPPETKHETTGQQPGVTRPGRPAGSGHRIGEPGNGTGELQRNGKPFGFSGGAGGHEGWGAGAIHGGAGGRSSNAPGHTRR